MWHYKEQRKEKNILLAAYEVRLLALRINCHIQHVIAGKLGAGKLGRRSKHLVDDLKEMKKLKEGSTRWHSVENSLLNRLWTCRKTD